MKNEELIKALRYCGDADYDCGEGKCPYYGKQPQCYVYDVLIDAADALEEAEKRIEKLSLDNKWIPCSERLPEHLESVIVHRKDGGIFMWEYLDNSPTDECWLDDRMYVYSFYDVTHWMPLPEPPKGEQE